MLSYRADMGCATCGRHYDRHPWDHEAHEKVAKRAREILQQLTGESAQEE